MFKYDVNKKETDMSKDSRTYNQRCDFADEVIFKYKTQEAILNRRILAQLEYFINMQYLGLWDERN
jgi:hypothetical protein